MDRHQETAEAVQVAVALVSEARRDVVQKGMDVVLKGGGQKDAKVLEDRRLIIPSDLPITRWNLMLIRMANSVEKNC